MNRDSLEIIHDFSRTIEGWGRDEAAEAILEACCNEAILSAASTVVNGCRHPHETLRRVFERDHILAAARDIHKDLLVEGASLTSPADAVNYLKAELEPSTRERFVVLFLNTRHRIIACEVLFEGSIDGAAVYPRVIAERALIHNAAAIIVAHNHPSGVAEPSLADQAITRRIKDALALLEIRLLDHFVIAPGNSPVSFASRGML